MKDEITLVGGSRIRWVEDGSASPEVPYLLVHGLGSGLVRWRDAMPLLAKHRRTIALDLPGYGRSDAPAGPYSPAWLAGATRAFMDAIGVERAILIGNSLGGTVAIYLAAAWPERVAGLVAVSPGLPNDGPQPDRKVVIGSLVPSIPVVGKRVFTRWMQRPADVLIAESLARNVNDVSRVPEETVRALTDELRERQSRSDSIRANVLSNRALMWALTGRRETTWKVVRSLKVPTLFLWGDSDKLIPVHVGYKAVTLVDGAQLVVLDDCGHNPQLDRPGEFAGAVVSFARALEALGERH